MSDIRVSGVRVSRGQQRVLDDVSFTARAGHVTALLGPNGSGKSSMLAAIAGDLPLAAGSIHLGALDVVQAAPLQAAQTRAVLTQSNEIAFDFHADAVVALARQPWRGREGRDGDRRIVADAMRDTDAVQFAGRGVLSLSGGEQARVQLARALAQTTGVLLLDEPTAALDLRHQAMALERARAAARAGAAVLVVLHDLDAAFAYADHIVVLARGRVRGSGTPSEIKAELLSDVYEHPVFIVRHPVTDRPLVVPLRGDVEVQKGTTS